MIQLVKVLCTAKAHTSGGRAHTHAMQVFAGASNSKAQADTYERTR
jgi:hypothetical protein